MRVENEGTYDLLSGEDMTSTLDAELKELEERIAASERWETQVIRRQDIDGEEVLLKTVPVGAEHLRARYEELLEMRRSLVGSA